MGATGTQTDWTTGPAKWAAVVVLGAASVFGLVWTVFWREPRPLVQPLVAADRTPPVEAAPASPAQSRPSAEPIRRPPPEPEPVPAATAPAPGRIDEAPPAAEPEAPPPAALGAPRLININTATAAELELLPGIGPALAGRIVEYRTTHGPFKSVDEIDHVSGIGPRTLAKIRPLATVK